MRTQSSIPRCPPLKWVLLLFSILFTLLALLLAFHSLPMDPFSSFTAPSVHPTDTERIVAAIVDKIEREITWLKDPSISISPLRYRAFLVEMLGLVESLVPRPTRKSRQDYAEREEGLEEEEEIMGDERAFMVEEMRKYLKVRASRLGRSNFMGANGTYTSVGHRCFSMREEVEEYMDYDVGDYCNDDWRLAQRLMVHGCDPLPRRRCFSRSPKFYTKPLPLPLSLWSLPDDRNVRWTHYRCKSFACLAANTTASKGFFKCSDCFNLSHHESPRWLRPVLSDPSTNSTPDFLIRDVINLKPGEIRIGLDFSVGTGTFAARMRGHNVTIVTAALNLGAPFCEMIALRGLVPIYVSVNQRLPFFDGTLDMVHTTRFLDGWIDEVLLEFVLYDWDRVLRPGGLLWVDAFFCMERDLERYVEAFEVLRYVKRMWAVVPKTDKGDGEVFLSAVLEKPPRPF